MTHKYLRMIKGMLAQEKGKTRRYKREWSVYILRCSDGSLYTGIAKNVAQRLLNHNAGRGARYTRTRRPVCLVYQKNSMTRPKALSREYELKKLSKQAKESLLKQFLSKSSV